MLGPWAVRPRLPQVTLLNKTQNALVPREELRQPRRSRRIPHRLVTFAKRPLIDAGQENKYSYLGIKSKLIPEAVN